MRNEKRRDRSRAANDDLFAKELIALRALGHETHLLSERQHQVGTRFEIRLRMADQEMSCHDAGADDAASKHANGAAESSADNHSAAAYTSIFISILLQARAGGDHSF